MTNSSHRGYCHNLAFPDGPPSMSKPVPTSLHFPDGTIIRRHETQAELEERYGETMQDFRRDAAEDHDSDRESDDSGLDADSMADTEDGEDAE